MYSYDTVSQAVTGLSLRGYTKNFNLNPDCLECAEDNLKLHPEDFEIDEIYRFEGASDPGDESIVYAISSVKYAVKGVLVNAYGIYADDIAEKLAQKLK